MRHHQPMAASGCLLLALLTISGCSDGSDPLEPEPFSVTIEVVDAAGDPVEGLRVSLSPDVAGVEWPFPAGTAAPGATHPTSVPPPARTEVTVEDVAGRPVYSQTFTEAPVQFTWSGVDDAGDHVHDGWYEMTAMVFEQGGNVPSAVVTHPLLLLTGTPEVSSAGTTGADGRLIVTDRTYVPAFWDPAPMPHTDEQGNVIGEITITTATRVVLLADDGAVMTHVFEAVDGPQTVPIVWTPKPRDLDSVVVGAMR
ncbi:MAG: FlgD immunoglobulin-like domain containing protein [Candidatus Krumholzibacteriia bacterium]